MSEQPYSAQELIEHAVISALSSVDVIHENIPLLDEVEQKNILHHIRIVERNLMVIAGAMAPPIEKTSANKPAANARDQRLRVGMI